MEKFEISHFQAAHCVRKKAISPKVFHRFSKTFLLLKDVENRYLAQKFHGRSYLSFAMVRWKLFSCGKIRNFPLSKKMLYHQRYFNRFSKTFVLLKDVENRYLAQEFHGRSYFSFSMVRWKLFSGGRILSFLLSSCTLCQKKCYITKGIQPILKNFPPAERCGKLIFGPKISWPHLF